MSEVVDEPRQPSCGSVRLAVLERVIFNMAASHGAKQSESEAPRRIEFAKVISSHSLSDSAVGTLFERFVLLFVPFKTRNAVP